MVFLLAGLFLSLSLFTSNCRCSQRNSDFDDIGVSGFLDELFFIEPSPRTPRFDDYTEGSYRVESKGLLKKVAERIEESGEPANGLIIIGPSGVLWTYYIFLFIEDSNSIQINYLVMPHGRITAKGKANIEIHEYKTLMDTLASIPSLTSLSAGRESDSDILIQNFGDGTTARVGSTSEMAEEDVRNFLRTINSLVDRVEFTYRNQGKGQE